MNGIELKCFRESLNLEVKAFAAMLEIDEQTVKEWEASPNPLPESIMDNIDDVESTIINLIEESIDDIEKSVKKKKPEEMSLIVYSNDDDMKKYNPEIFELIPSAMAHRGALWEVKLEIEEETGVKVVLVNFHKDDYEKWLKNNHLNHSNAQLANWGAQYQLN